MNKQLQSLETQFSEYVDQKRKKFDLKKLGIHADLRELSGTILQKAVWRELLSIPYGKTISYSDLAIRVGKPKAVRAVASAVANNPICIIIPCHRVIPKQEKKQMKQLNIGNYALGRGMKKILLQLEGVIS